MIKIRKLFCLAQRAQRNSLEKAVCMFSSATLNITEDTFKLVVDRLEMKVEEARKMEEILNEAANNYSMRVNAQEIRMKLNQMSPAIGVHDRISSLEKNIKDCYEMLTETSEEEDKRILKEQLAILEKERQSLKSTAIELLVPADAYDDVNEIYMELRSGAGGSESAVFVEDVSQMLTNYSEGMGWRVSTIVGHKETVASRGYKYLKLRVHGEQCYRTLKCEAGVHKVIRVPQTESKGRLHSSTISVVVMPSIPFNFRIDPKDIKYQFCRSSGAGGQSVNKTDSACRATHIPTGLSVFNQQERAQDQNKKRATEILKEKLFQNEYRKTVEEESRKRKMQVGTMDRSEKIRTYNFPQDRITDHRTGLTLFGIENMLSGNLLSRFIDSYQNKVFQDKLTFLLNELKKPN